MVEMCLVDGLYGGINIRNKRSAEPGALTDKWHATSPAPQSASHHARHALVADLIIASESPRLFNSRMASNASPPDDAPMTV